jgi:hypothetical protein
MLVPISIECCLNQSIVIALAVVCSSRFLSNHIRINFHISEFFVISIVAGIYAHVVLTSILN